MDEDPKLITSEIPKSPERKTLQFFDIFRTHPRPQTRIKAIKANPDTPYSPVMSDNDWQVLKSACTRKQ